jgi:hypothetical protein
LQTKNRFQAELWKELFDAEGVATRIVLAGESGAGDLAPRKIFVPDSKTHVAAEIMRKI